MEWKFEDNCNHHLKVLIATKQTVRLWLRFGYHLNEDVSDGFYFIAELRDISKKDSFLSSHTIDTRKDLNDIVREYSLTYQDGAKALLHLLSPFFNLHLCHLDGLPMYYADNALYLGVEHKSFERTRKYLKWTDDVCSLTPEEIGISFNQFLLMYKDAMPERKTATVVAEFKQWLLEHGYNARRQAIANAALETIKDIRAMLEDGEL